MVAEEEEFDSSAEIAQMSPDSYILLDEEQDRDAAHRWHVANEIRKKRIGAKAKICEYLRKNVGREVSGEELRYVAGDTLEWARRVRELRTEEGWPVVTKTIGTARLTNWCLPPRG